MADFKVKNNLVVQGSSGTIGGVDITTISGTQTLTNKTVDADQNTVSNIDNGNIKSGAGIDVTKLHDGSVDNTKFGYLSGLTSDVQTQIGNKISSSEKGANNGVATLDAGGKVPVSQLPNSVMEFKGTFDPATATFTDAAGNAGDVLLASAAGSYDAGSGSITYAIGDWAVHNGTIYEKSLNSNTVVSVNGQQGVVTLDAGDLAVTPTGDISSTDVQSALAELDSEKQPLDATLTALASHNTNGILTQTAADTFTGRTITAGSTKLSVTDGNGVAGNPTLDVVPGNIAIADLSGTLAINKGGTGQTSQTAAFDALSPLTTKGDIITHDGTNNIRLPVGTNGQALVADSGETSGLKYATIPLSATGDINETSFSASNNVTTPADVTGLAFANGSVRSFKAMVHVVIDATASLYEAFELHGIQQGAAWSMSQTSVGDDSNIVFSITTTGQIQYVSGNEAGFVSSNIKFRAITLS